MQKDASMSRRSFAALGAAALASACAGALAPRGAAWADPSGTASVEAENGCVRITHPDLPTSSNIPQATRDDPPRASVTIGSTAEPSWLSVSGVPAHRDCEFLRVTVSDGAGGFAEVARYDEDEGKPSLLAWDFDLGATALHFRQSEIGGDAFNLKMRLVEPVAFPLAFRYEYAPAPVYTISFHADRGSGSEVVAVYERHYLDERGEPPAVSRPGCLLVGWRDMDGPASGPPAWYEPTLWMERADLDFEAVWEAREYAVSYDLAGGTLDGAATAAGRVVGFSDKGILPVSGADPTREGFAFAGWAWQGRPVAPDDSVESLAGDDSVASLELVAQWTEAPAGDDVPAAGAPSGPDGGPDSVKTVAGGTGKRLAATGDSPALPTALSAVAAAAAALAASSALGRRGLGGAADDE